MVSEPKFRHGSVIEHFLTRVMIEQKHDTLGRRNDAQPMGGQVTNAINRLSTEER